MDTQIRSVNIRLKKAGIAFILVLLIGMTGYRFLTEGTSWFEGLYMTFLTVTTIGFAEIVNLDGNTPGRIFTIFIAISGIGILTYSFSNIAALIIENDFSKHLKKKQMEKAIKKMNEHYLICGASKLGIHIAEELEKTKRPFLICDIDKELLENMEERFDYGKILIGDCTDEGFLEKMNIEKANGIFVTTRNDHNNIVIVVTARQMCPDLRIVSECIKSENHKKLTRVGADKVISPSFIGGLRMASEMVRPTVTNFLDEMLRDTNLNLRIEEIDIPSSFVGKTLQDLPIKNLHNTLVLAVKDQNKWIYNPTAAYQLNKNMTIILMTSPEELKTLRASIN